MSELGSEGVATYYRTSAKYCFGKPEAPSAFVKALELLDYS